METKSPTGKFDYTVFQKKNKNAEGETNGFDNSAYKALKAAALEKRNQIRMERKELTKAQREEMATLRNNYKA